MQLMIFAKEVSLIDGERINEVLDLVLKIAAQSSKVTRERGRACRLHAIDQSAIDVVSLRLVEDHSRSPI
jgi:hypothetical protein